MITREVIFFTIFACLNLFPIGANAQNYYWSNGVKVNLQEDSSSFVLYGENANLENLKSAGLEITHHKAPDEGRYAIVKGTGSVKSASGALEGNKSFALIRNSKDTAYLSNFLVLRLNSDLFRFQLNQILQRYNGTIISEKYRILKVKIQNLSEVIACANEIYESNIAQWCHPDFLVKYHSCSVDNWEKQYYLYNRSHGNCTLYNDIGAYDAWKITKGCADIRVAVIDHEGVGDHPALKDENNNSRVLPGYTTFDGTQGRPAIGSNSGHGQACAGIIAASHNSEIRGIAPNVKIVPVKIRANSAAPVSEYALGINWAWDSLGGNADILSNSWGESGTPDDVVIQAILDAQTEGRNGKGAIVVFAAGNDGKTSVSEYSKRAISVGAINEYDKPGMKTNRLGVKSRYTNIGVDLDLVAYGGDNYATLGSSVLHGDIRALDIAGNNGYVSGDYYDEFTGTSAACPQVAGVAALVLSVNPDLSRQEVENILFTTATDLGDPGKDISYGYGKVNAFRAVQEAINTLDTMVFAPLEFYIFEPNYREKEKEDEKIIFAGSPGCNIAAGAYYCDIYKSSFTIQSENTDWVWFFGDGLSFSNPNNGKCSYSKVYDPASGTITLSTYYYFIKANLLGQSVNQWAPVNPNNEWARKFWINQPKDLISNQRVVSGQSVDLAATHSITLLDGFEVEEGGLFTTSTACSPDKINCNPAASTMASVSTISSVSGNMSITQPDSVQGLHIVTEKVAGGINISLSTESGSNQELKARIFIYAGDGSIISQQEMDLNVLTFFPVRNPGNYEIKVVYSGYETFKIIEI